MDSDFDIMAEQITRMLEEEGYSHAIVLPCGKAAKLVESIEGSSLISSILVTREEEGFGVAAGLYLSGNNPFMLIQSSGLGNSINAICSLLFAYEIPLLIVASYRGYYGESMEAQNELGRRLPGVLRGLGVEYVIVDELTPDYVDYFKDVNSVKVVLLSPRLFE